MSSAVRHYDEPSALEASSPSHLVPLAPQSGRAGADLIAAMHELCFDPASSESWRAREVGKILQLPGTRAVLAMPSPADASGGGHAEHPPAGFAVFRVIAGEAELLSLGVCPEYRNLGLASHLVHYVVEVCRKADIDAVFLEVRADNLPAQALYEKFGFTQVGTRPAYYRVGPGRTIDARTMRYAFHRS